MNVIIFASRIAGNVIIFIIRTRIGPNSIPKIVPIIANSNENMNCNIRRIHVG